MVAVEPGFVWVETERQTTCGGCSVRSGCGTGVLSRLVGRRQTRVRTINSIDAVLGERVVIGLRESALLQGSLAVYLAPLLALLGGAALAETFAPEPIRDVTTVLGGVLGMAAGLIWLRRFGRRVRVDTRYQPVTLRRVPNVSFVEVPTDAQLRTENR